MATGKVTKRSVDAVKAGTADQFLWDDDLRGFGLKVTPAGKKVYLLQYRMGGRGAATERMTIGTHGSPWTPATARDEAERLLTLVRQDKSPAQEKKERRRIEVDLAFEPYSRNHDGIARERCSLLFLVPPVLATLSDCLAEVLE